MKNLLATAVVLAALSWPCWAGSPKTAEEGSEEDETKLTTVEQRWEQLPQKVKEVLTNVDEANSKINAARAELAYVKAIPLLDIKDSSRGRLVLKKPGSVFIELGEPRSEDIYCDGEKWWVISHDDEQVLVFETAETTDVAQEAAFLRIGYERKCRDLLKDYDISMNQKRVPAKDKGDSEKKNEDEDKPENHTIWEYKLTFSPRGEDSTPRYSTIEVSLTEQRWLPHQVVLTESDGEIVHRYKLSNIERNIEVKPELFRYDPPEGYNVVPAQHL